MDEASGTQAIDDDETEEIPKSIGRNNGLTLTETVIVDNRMRQSLVYLPCGYHSEENDKRPLVIVLHGSRLNGTIAKAVTKFDALACEKDFIVAYPNALYKQWNDGRGKGFTPAAEVNDVHFILRLAEVMTVKYAADPKRVYLVGYSSGGMLAQKIAMEASDKVAGIGVVAATLPMRQYEKAPKSTEPMPVVMLMGTNDRAFPWEGGQTNILGVNLGGVSSVKRMVEYWLSANGGIQKEMFLDEDLPNTTTDVEASKYQTKNNVQVTLYKINGGGHTWPGARLPFTYIPFLGRQVKNLNAAQVIWRTLSQFHR
ncbi:MAG: alpha/beta fold hydrolase [Vampirovibrionales bacterium]|nr:alpha/beta fold hydrolase [Vampirovibrionales bacterium]